MHTLARPSSNRHRFSSAVVPAKLHARGRSRKLLFDGQIVLVCDVGGGTSDFSLIRVARDGDRIDFTRTAVGKLSRHELRKQQPSRGAAPDRQIKSG